MKKTSLLVAVIGIGVLLGAINPGVLGTGASDVAGDGKTISRSLSLNPASDSPDPGAFSFEVDRVERCGTTCGKVTAALTNKQDRQAADVVVDIRLFAGRNPESGERIWTGKEHIGTMAAHETVRVTRQGEAPISAARAVPSHGGWVTIVVTIESDEATTVFEGKEKIAV